MNLWNRVRKFFGLGRAQTKSWWSPYYGQAWGGTYDAFGGQPEPSKADLVKAYEDITYACVSMISSNIAHVPIRLYVRTEAGDRQPKCATKPITSKRIKQKYYGQDVREVTEHPALDLIHCCNSYHNKVDLFELTSIYLDTTGNSYWLMGFNELGIPEELYLLPSHLVEPVRDANYFIKEWRVQQGSDQKTYPIRDVIHYKYNSPSDPYGEGVSPLRGAWGRRQISSKELSYLDNYLSNQGRPDAVLSVKDSINPLEAERVAKEWRHRNQGQGNGGILVVDGTMNLQPLNFPAKDLAELQLYQVLKTVICNCFHIPPDIFELGVSSNRSTKEAAIYSFANDCLTPRIQGIVQKLNDRLLPYFDKRLFFEADSIIPEDKQHELAVDTMLISQRVVTADEVRVKYGYTSQAWAQEPLLPSGVMPADAFDVPATDQAATEPVQAAPDRSGQAASIQALQAAVYAGQLPREAGLAQLQILYGMSPAEAEALLPEAEQAAPVTPGQPQPEEEASEPVTDEQAPAAASNDLRATVGGSVAVADLQRSYYRRELPREAAIANAVLIFGFSEEEAGLLFPELFPNAPQEQAQPADDQGEPAEQQDQPAELPDDQGEKPEDKPPQPPAEQPKAKARHRPLRQLAPGPLIKALQKFFGKLGSEVMGKIKAVQHADTKAITVVDYFNVDAWTDTMLAEMRPVLATYYDHAAKETLTNLNLTSSMFNTVQPKLKEGVDRAAMVFSQETLATTNQSINDAVTSLRKEVTEGLIQGDVKNEMMKRVQKVFTEAETDRAFKIGVTEASRGQHNAMIITAKESGVVTGKTWLSSADQCELCKPLNGKTVGLDESFVTDGVGPYAEITAPPRHPNCRCTLLLDTGG